MKRFVIGFLMVGLVAGPVAAAGAEQPHRTKAQRTVVGSYAAYPSPVTGCNAVLGSWACMVVPTRAGERYVSVRVTDTHGQPVYFSVLGDGLDAGFCGRTTRPVPFSKGRDLEIEVGVSRWVVQTDCPARSVKTTGTIRVTLSDRP